MEWLVMIAVNGVGFVFGLVVGSTVSYQRGWHGGLSFRNGCDQEMVNAMSLKDHKIHELKAQVAKLQNTINCINGCLQKD